MRVKEEAIGAVQLEQVVEVVWAIAISLHRPRKPVALPGGS